MLTETLSRTGEPRSLLGPLAEEYRILTRYVARVRTALWAWDADAARQLIDEVYAEHETAIVTARRVAKRYDRREEEADAELTGDSQNTGRAQVPPRLDPADVPDYVLSGPAAILEFVRGRVSREASPSPEDAMNGFRYRFADHPDGVVEMRGYSWSGDPFNVEAFLARLDDAFPDPGGSISFSTTEGEDESEFSTSLRLLISRSNEPGSERIQSSPGIVDIAIQGDLIQAVYTMLDPSADPTLTFERIASAADGALPASV